MKYLSSKEYNSLVQVVCHSADYILNEEKFDKIFDKLFKITEDDLLKKESINHPIKETNKKISNDYWQGTR